MEQQVDKPLVKMLNNIRIATLNDDAIVTLKSKFVDPSIADLQSDTLHIFTENVQSDTRNIVKLETLDNPLHNIPSIDLVP